MSLPAIPDIKTADAWTGRCLRAMRHILQVRFFGLGGVTAKAVTFDDLVELGLVSRGAAEQQARKQK